MHSERLGTWVSRGNLQRYVEYCIDQLSRLAGERWKGVSASEVTPRTALFFIEGDTGAAVVTVRFDEHGRLDGYGVAVQPRSWDGIGAISIACPPDRVDALAEFYAEHVAGTPLGFGESGDDYRAPRWGEPERPQQMHLDIFISDLDDAHRRALAAGATLLHSAEDTRVYADPVGHAFWLCLDDRSGGPPGVVGRVVIDCFSPRSLAPFYEALLDMPARLEDNPDRVVIASTDAPLPMLGFQRVSPYIPPRWGDPRYPQQMHLDMVFDDAEAAGALAPSNSAPSGSGHSAGAARSTPIPPATPCASA